MSILQSVSIFCSLPYYLYYFRCTKTVSLSWHKSFTGVVQKFHCGETKVPLR